MSSKVIFITGCSTGIGLKASQALSKRGHRVIASCRKLEDVNRLIEQGIEALQMDLSSSESIRAGFEELMIKVDGRLDVLINNAGYGQAGALEDISRDALRQQFETNVFGLMELTRLVIPVMRAQRTGRIINISSILGVISLPFRGAYNASKYAVEGLTDTLRLELKPSGIEVICIEPGPITSQFRETSVSQAQDEINMTESHFNAQYQRMLGDYRMQKKDSIFTKSPEAVVNKLIHAIESKKPKAKYLVTLPAYLFIMLKRLLSVKMMDKLLIAVSKKELGA
ncbi:SDR family NAD(P)-dependent oxidoreductase [Legionella impletisoli]|uniref:Short-chain dehydrogenase/reductase n=1 Tax=Legionella impletisoli TaxID=343510 RepID=A0A917N8M5_9GAMM|nr:SDR family NAD(P)-dependent oxidoreductase [Legionella impletisoli]GGI78015.1 short-chain dehydrogenase/reductase [Legionella impletisoli]